MKQNALLLLALAAMFGCSKSDRLSDDDANGLSIQLSSRINDTGATRGGGVIEGNLPSKSLDVDIFHADMDEPEPDGEYPDKWDEKIRGTLATTGKISLRDIKVYPADPGQKSRFAGVYPQGGTYDKETWSVTYAALDGATDVMCSDIAEGYAGITSDPLLTFSHLLTKIEVKLLAQDEENNTDAIEEIINAWGEITSITVKDKRTSAKVTLPVPDFEDPLTSAAGAIEATGKVGDGALPLWTKAGETPDPTLLTNAAVPFGYAMFVPTEVDGEETLTLTIAFADGRTETVVTPAQEFVAGTGYTITIAFEKQEISTSVIYLDGAFTDWVEDDENAIDKSEKKGTVTTQLPTTVPDGLSNAYIVAPEGMVKFKVSRAYKYDETTEVFTGNLRMDDSEYTGAFTTAIVWSDADVIETPTVVGSGKNAVVTVKAKSGVAGNAVVAIKNSSDDIVWSYHIWVTDYNPNDTDLQYINEYEYDNNEYSFTFMDRNLGASAAGSKYSELANAGLFYQWGRKDPFPATGTQDDGKYDVVDISSSGTIEYTIKNPNKFIKIDASPNDWLSTPDPNLWGHVSGKKSYYDPCPSGWHVPVSSSGTADDSPWKGFTLDGKTFDGGYNFGINALYPITGQRNRSTSAIGFITTHGMYWSASPSSSGDTALSLYFRNGLVTLTNAHDRAHGQAVRCVKE
jgi:hypothetical protein